MIFSLSAWAKKVTIEVSDDDEPVATWHCSVSAFTDTFDAVGSSKTEAKYKAQKACTAKNNKMHCEDVKCESEDEGTSKKGWVCRVSAFTDDFEAFGHSKTEAKYKVQKACTAKNNKMHCEDVKCTTDDD